MRSPFEVFRRNQKVMMVLLVGLAMFAFILLDPFTSGTPMPRWLVIAILASLMAGVGWVVGTQVHKRRGAAKGKSSATDYALWGGLIGVCLGVGLWYFQRPLAMVETTAGNLSRHEFDELTRRRQKANQFLTEAEAAVTDPRFLPFLRQFRRPPGFGYGVGQSDPPSPYDPRDVLFGYLLRKEADEMGIHVSDQAVTAYINQVTEDKLSKEAYVEIRNKLGLSESQLFDYLRDGLKAQMAFNNLIPRLMPTPMDYWQGYRKLRFRQQVEVAQVPVDVFVAQVQDPADDRLRELFERYKDRLPGQGPPDEPGFKQPHRVQAAYVMADFQTIQKEVVAKNPVTDAEIEAYYLKHLEDEFQNPELASQAKPIPEQPQPTTPDDGPVRAPRPDADEAKETSALDADGLSFVALQDGQPGVDDEPIKAPRPFDAGDPFAGFDPPVKAIKPYQPLSAVKEGIRQTLEKQRTVAEIDRRLKPIQDAMGEISNSLIDAPDEFDPVKASEKLKAAAEKQGLRYVVTRTLSAEGLTEAESLFAAASEPSASTGFNARPNPRVSEVLYPSNPNADQGEVDRGLYKRRRAVDAEDNHYLYWKIKAKAAHEAKFTDDGVREQVLEAWKHREARKLAEARAKELVKLVESSGKPMAEALAEATVLPDGKGPKLIVTDPHNMRFSFAWLRESRAPQRGLQQQQFQPPRMDFVPGVQNPGDEFMNVVWNELDDGEVGVAPSADKSVYHVVRVVNRTPSTREFRERHAEYLLKKEGVFDANRQLYSFLTDADRRSFGMSWIERLNKKYDVRWNVDIDNQDGE